MTWLGKNTSNWQAALGPDALNCLASFDIQIQKDGCARTCYWRAWRHGRICTNFYGLGTTDRVIHSRLPVLFCVSLYCAISFHSKPTIMRTTLQFSAFLALPAAHLPYLVGTLVVGSVHDLWGVWITLTRAVRQILDIREFKHFVLTSDLPWPSE